MKAIFNKEIINDHNLLLDVDDRAIQYGDGLFETIIIGENHINLLDYHYSRLLEGVEALNIELPSYFTLQYLKTSIPELININKFIEPARIKVQVWRSSGGFYEPLSNSANILITIRHHKSPKNLLKNVGIATSTKNYLSPYSKFKTTNALNYILASIEKQNSNYDDLIILDQDGNISELLYSNIFWIKKDIFYTPSLNTGCVCGVMRSFLIDRIVHKGIELKEIRMRPDTLKNVDHVFATNAAGIIPIVGINGVRYKVYPGLNNIV